MNSTSDIKQDWRRYFITLSVFWVIIPCVLFLAFLPYWETGLMAVTVWTGIFIGGGVYKFDKDLNVHIKGIEPGQMGVMMLAGRIILILPSGFGFLPSVPGVLTLKIYSIRERNSAIDLIGIETSDSAQVDWAKLGLKKSDFEDLNLSRQMKIDLKLNIFWQPEEDPQEFARYIKNIADHEGNEDQADKKFIELAPDIAKGIVLSETNKRTVTVINHQREEMSRILCDKMQTAVSYPDDRRRCWGVKINKINIGQLDPPESVVAKMSERTIFEIEQYMKLKSAKTEGEVIEVLGESNAQAEIFKFKAIEVGERLITLAKGMARAKNLGALAKALDMKEPDLILKLEAMENTFKNTEKVLFTGSGELSNLFGFLPLLSTALKQAGIGEGK